MCSSLLGLPSSAVCTLLLTCGALGLAPDARAECGACAPASWERLETGAAPPARLDASLAADPARRQLLMFGGRSQQGFLGDLWSLDLASLQWRQLEGAGPSPRSGASLVVEPDTGRLLLFGGYQTDASGRIVLLNDLWTRPATGGWSREYVPGPPAPRAWHAALVAEGVLFVFGGFTRAEGAAGAYLQDLWALELQSLTWRRAATDGGPRMAGRPALAWRPGSRALLVFGRDGVPVPASGGFWLLEPERDRWAAPEVAAGLPLDFGLAAAGAAERVLLLRGPTYLAPSWGIWTTAPGRACCAHAAGSGPAGGEGIACAPEPDRADAWLCFGGAYEARVSGDTWRVVAPAEVASP
ncbi:MAG TPA: kelch repeat-containing protein [Myxococcota bacterium]|nr:kelch repeat-containing protein [Myxococcota bacterium]HRY94008.1 kelch repeat-containing protein [Myxococcota bacterium]